MKAAKRLMAAATLWGNPTRGSIDASIFKSPPSATWWERRRDAWLGYMVLYERTFLAITFVGLLGLLGFGAFIVVLLLSRL